MRSYDEKPKRVSEMASKPDLGFCMGIAIACGREREREGERNFAKQKLTKHALNSRSVLRSRIDCDNSKSLDSKLWKTVFKVYAHDQLGGKKSRSNSSERMRLL